MQKKVVSEKQIQNSEQPTSPELSRYGKPLSTAIWYREKLQRTDGEILKPKNIRPRRCVNIMRGAGRKWLRTVPERSNFRIYEHLRSVCRASNGLGGHNLKAKKVIFVYFLKSAPHGDPIIALCIRLGANRQFKKFNSNFLSLWYSVRYRMNCRNNKSLGEI